VNSVDAGEVWLFSYGTLRQPEVQRAIFGRLVEGRADVLPGYALSTLEIVDPGVITASGCALHPIARNTGNPVDKVTGVALRISRAELAAADTYEVSDYVRVTVRLGSGTEAFAYVSAR
jgi:gamma-glutamylcyclotransferase (GGCT)/AIG2-like uncharacterized protein YtfP